MRQNLTPIKVWERSVVRVTQNDTEPIGLYRLKSIVGPGGLIPVSRSTWYVLLKRGIVPKPVRIGRSVAWRARDIAELIERGTLEKNKRGQPL